MGVEPGWLGLWSPGSDPNSNAVAEGPDVFVL